MEWFIEMFNFPGALEDSSNQSYQAATLPNMYLHNAGD